GTPRVRRLPEVLLRERVDVRLRLVAGVAVDDAALDLGAVVAVLRVDPRERHPGLALQVARLLPAERRVDEDVAVLRLHPDRRHLRRAVGVDGGEVPELRPLDRLADLLGQLNCHSLLLLGSLPRRYLLAMRLCRYSQSRSKRYECRAGGCGACVSSQRTRAPLVLSKAWTQPTLVQKASPARST